MVTNRTAQVDGLSVFYDEKVDARAAERAVEPAGSAR
jgi:hypothetical protein